jgi:hypothetical protein
VIERCAVVWRHGFYVLVWNYYSCQSNAKCLLTTMLVILVRAVQYSTVQHSTAQHSTVQYSTVQYTTPYITVRYYRTQYGTLPYNVVPVIQYTTVQCYTKQIIQYRSQETIQYHVIPDGTNYVMLTRTLYLGKRLIIIWRHTAGGKFIHWMWWWKYVDVKWGKFRVNVARRWVVELDLFCLS